MGAAKRGFLSETRLRHHTTSKRLAHTGKEKVSFSKTRNRSDNANATANAPNKGYSMEIKPIARIHTDFPEKFGIPRQSNLVARLRGTIVFEPECSQPECVRGIEGYDYLWLIWGFDHGRENTWSPTVRPPILGGNKRMGVFATRSPFRISGYDRNRTCASRAWRRFARRH